MPLFFRRNGSAEGASKDEALTADLMDWAEKERPKVADDRRIERCRPESITRMAPKTPVPPEDGDHDRQRRTPREPESVACQLGHAVQQTRVRQAEFRPLDGAKSTTATVVVLAVRNDRHDQGEAFFFDDAREARSFVQVLLDRGLDHKRIAAVSGQALRVKLTHRPPAEFGQELRRATPATVAGTH